VTKTDPFSRRELSAAGFVGWVPFGELEASLASIPSQAHGVYLVQRERGSDPPAWVTPSPVGMTWRGDPTVSVDQLEANWVPGATVVYIGKAKQHRLRKRLREFQHYGEGRNARHGGGRLIWQLPNAPSLRVAWRVLPNRLDALAVESELISDFTALHSKPPFANRPQMWGR
jgi:hypothetical protein